MSIPMALLEASERAFFFAHNKGSCWQGFFSVREANFWHHSPPSKIPLILWVSEHNAKPVHGFLVFEKRRESWGWLMVEKRRFVSIINLSGLLFGDQMWWNYWSLVIIFRNLFCLTSLLLSSRRIELSRIPSLRDPLPSKAACPCFLKQVAAHLLIRMTAVKSS